MTKPRACGCDSDEGHHEPWVDLELSLFHGERDPDGCGDPPPAGACLCGHPEYWTCRAWARGEGSVGSMTIAAPRATE